jgi:hypothetical protein
MGSGLRARELNDKSSHAADFITVITWLIIFLSTTVLFYSTAYFVV